MQIVPINQILVEERQRQDLKPKGITELRADILKNGLYHPLVVEQQGDKYRLLAGGRRLEAIKSIGNQLHYKCGDRVVPPAHVPITLFSDLSPEQQIEIELHENLLRADLEWQEKEAAIAKLHNLRVSQNASHRIVDTARELSEVKGETLPTTKNNVARALLISNHLHEPSVKNARSANEAHQAILRSMEADIVSRIHRRKKHTSPHIFIPGDLNLELCKLEENQFDVIIADPPYGLDADSFGSTTTKHHYSDDKTSALKLSSFILTRGFELCKQHAFLFFFCDIELFLPLREMARISNWKPWRTPLVWDKGTASGIEPIPGRGFYRSYELLLFCTKGDRARGDAMADVLHVPRVSVPGHSSAKPPALYQLLLSRSGNAGDTVLDPCAGVGTIFHAARTLNWIATGVEIDSTCAPLCEAAAIGVGNASANYL